METLICTDLPSAIRSTCNYERHRVAPMGNRMVAPSEGETITPH